MDPAEISFKGSVVLKNSCRLQKYTGVTVVARHEASTHAPLISDVTWGPLCRGGRLRSFPRIFTERARILLLKDIAQTRQPSSFIWLLRYSYGRVCPCVLVCCLDSCILEFRNCGVQIFTKLKRSTLWMSVCFQYFTSTISTLASANLTVATFTRSIGSQ